MTEDELIKAHGMTPAQFAEALREHLRVQHGLNAEHGLGSELAGRVHKSLHDRGELHKKGVHL